MSITRRTFLGTAAAAATAALFLDSKSHASALGLPIGLQLYSVRTLLPNDFDGTLKQVAALGYQEVEGAGFFNHSADEVNAAMKAAGLRLVSTHYPLSTLLPQIDTIIPFCKSLGLQYIVCSSPMHRQPGGGREPLTLDDWHWNIEQFNTIGEKIRASGMHFAYHNHVETFAVTEGKLPYDELMAHTEPDKVSFEMDCGWVIAAGHNPIELLKQYGARIVMLHVKDFDNNKPPSVELGTGSIDYKPIFAAAKKYAHIRHCFVEQEEFSHPIMEALKVDATYMQRFRG